MKSNKNATECPFCENMQIGDPESPLILCEMCGENYCFYHSKAHPNMTCEQVKFVLIHTVST